MMSRSVQCFARGRPGAWQGLCVDLDIAVQGASFEDVRARLDHAVSTYVEDAAAEDPATARKLLSRRAPLWVRLKLATAYLGHLLSAGRGGDREFKAGFDLPCRA